MAKPRWHILQDDGAVTLCRHLPPRFDFAARTVLPGGRPVRLAHQIRQDMWRALQRVRGFSPVVRLEHLEDGWFVMAGGRVAGFVPQTVVAQVQAVLDNPALRDRWMRSARIAS